MQKRIRARYSGKNQTREDRNLDALLSHLTYFECKMVDHRIDTTHAEKNQGEIFKVRDQRRGDRYLDAFLPHLTYYQVCRGILWRDLQRIRQTDLDGI
jgi:hypothetical protein